MFQSQIGMLWLCQHASWCKCCRKSAQARDYLALQCHQLVYLSQLVDLSLFVKSGPGFTEIRTNYTNEECYLLLLGHYQRTCVAWCAFNTKNDAGYKHVIIFYVYFNLIVKDTHRISYKTDTVYPIILQTCEKDMRKCFRFLNVVI